MVKGSNPLGPVFLLEHKLYKSLLASNDIMALNSADLTRQYWNRMIKAAKEDHGSAIDVILEENPHKVNQVGHFYLALPFVGRGLTIGYAKRGTGIQPYSADVLKQLRHQTGLRLEKLADKFVVDFSAPVLGIEKTPATKEFYESLKSPDLPKTMDIIKDPWIDRKLADLIGALELLP